jgi:hypothetical protein
MMDMQPIWGNMLTTWFKPYRESLRREEEQKQAKQHQILELNSLPRRAVPRPWEDLASVLSRTAPTLHRHLDFLLLSRLLLLEEEQLYALTLHRFATHFIQPQQYRPSGSIHLTDISSWELPVESCAVIDELTPLWVLHSWDFFWLLRQWINIFTLDVAGNVLPWLTRILSLQTRRAHLQKDGYLSEDEFQSDATYCSETVFPSTKLRPENGGYFYSVI